MQTAKNGVATGPKKSFSLLKSRRQKDAAFSLLLLTPAIICCVIFILFPIIDSVKMSFTTYKIANLTQNIPGEWNNFANYTRLWSSGKLQDSIQVTLLFVFVTVALSFVIGMALALMLNSNIRGARFLRSVMMIPWVIPTVISGLLWAWIYANPYGLLQYVISVVTDGRVTGFGILNNQETAIWGVIIVALWKQIPLITLLLLAGHAERSGRHSGSRQAGRRELSPVPVQDHLPLYAQRHRGDCFAVHHRQLQAVPAVCHPDQRRPCVGHNDAGGPLLR